MIEGYRLRVLMLGERATFFGPRRLTLVERVEKVCTVGLVARVEVE